MLQRRAVLAALGSTVAAAMAPVSVFVNSHRAYRQQLAEIIGDTVRLTDPDGNVVHARLVALDGGPRCPGLEQFSVVFEGDDLGDGVYEAYHRDTGVVTVSLMRSDTPAHRRTRKRAYFSIFV